jgi:hypothetical protein
LLEWEALAVAKGLEYAQRVDYIAIDKLFLQIRIV